MQRRIKMLTLAVATIMVAGLGACTVHHHHPDAPNQPVASYQEAPTAAPGQVEAAPAPDSYGSPGPYRSPGTPIAPYATPRYAPGAPYAAAPQRPRSRDCDCDCTEHQHQRAPAPAYAPRTIAPRSYAPAGPVQPKDTAPSNPADWLE